jgi:hypothetical protein
VILPLDFILKNTATLSCFQDFMAAEQQQHVLDFWQAANRWRVASVRGEAKTTVGCKALRWHPWSGPASVANAAGRCAQEDPEARARLQAAMKKHGLQLFFQVRTQRQRRLAAPSADGLGQLTGVLLMQYLGDEAKPPVDLPLNVVSAVHLALSQAVVSMHTFDRAQALVR